LFDKLGRTPPAAPDELAAAFMALSHGLALQRMSTRPDPSGRLIMVFLRGLIAGAKGLEAVAVAPDGPAPREPKKRSAKARR
jgi:hypothetical protein